MVGRQSKLTREVWATIVDTIRQGAFDWVAAEAAGIGRRTFYEWLKRGEQGDEPFAEFLADVERARGEARATAELLVRRTNPLAWLRLGPGRERPERPGWTAPSAPGTAEAEIDAGEAGPCGVYRRVLGDPQAAALLRPGEAGLCAGDSVPTREEGGW